MQFRGHQPQNKPVDFPQNVYIQGQRVPTGAYPGQQMSPGGQLPPQTQNPGQGIANAAGTIGSIAGMGTGLGAIPAIASIGLGAAQTIVGLRGLRNMGPEPEGFSVAPEAQQAFDQQQDQLEHAQRLQGIGFRPQERAAFEASMARSQAGQMRGAREMGGGSLAQATHRALDASALRARTQFAAEDSRVRDRRDQFAAQRADAMMGSAQQFQRIKDMQTQLEIDQYRRRQEAFAGALQSGLLGMTGAFNQWQGVKWLQDN